MTARFTLDLTSRHESLAPVAENCATHVTHAAHGMASTPLSISTPLPATGSASRAERAEASVSPTTSGSVSDQARDTRHVFIPEGYEPNYAYPLLVWIQSPQDGEAEFTRWMSEISSRNYIGVAFKATLPSEDPAVDRLDLLSPETAALPQTESLLQCEQRLQELVSSVRREFHIHSERVFLVGHGDQGTLALRLALQRPEWFGGVAAMGAGFPQAPHLLQRYRDLRGKRVYLGGAQRDQQTPLSEVYRTSRLLHTAGLRVCTRVYEAGHEVTRPMLSDIDRWVMKSIYEPQPVA